MESTAKREARTRWNRDNPSSTVRLPRKDYELLQQVARDRNMTQHGLLKQIVLEWLEKNAAS